MSKIIVRKQEYANNGTHADEIKAVVRDDLVVNTLSSATDLVPSVGLVKSETDAIKDALSPYKSEGFSNSTSYGTVLGMRVRSGHTVYLSFEVNLTAALSSGVLFTVPSGYRPITSIGSMLAFYKTTGAETHIYTRTVQVSTSGEVTQQISGSIPSGSKLSAYFTYRTSDAMPS